MFTDFAFDTQKNFLKIATYYELRLDLVIHSLSMLIQINSSVEAYQKITLFVRNVYIIWSHLPYHFVFPNAKSVLNQEEIYGSSQWY